MVNLKHIGIYVHDINIIESFYKNCFNMVPVCETYDDTGLLYKELFGTESKVKIAKVITDYGKRTGQGEMLELIQLTEGAKSNEIYRRTQDYGISHISLGDDDIEHVVDQVLKNAGKQLTNILSIGPRKCCFCSDPEGNVIEVIE